MLEVTGYNKDLTSRNYLDQIKSSMNDNQEKMFSDQIMMTPITQRSLNITYDSSNKEVLTQAHMLTTQSDMNSQDETKKNFVTNTLVECCEKIPQETREHQDYRLHKEQYSQSYEIISNPQHKSNGTNQFLSSNPINQQKTVKNSVGFYSSRRKGIKDISVTNIHSRLQQLFIKTRGSNILQLIGRALQEKTVAKRDKHLTDYCDIYQSYQQHVIQLCTQQAQQYMDGKNHLNNAGFQQQQRGIMVPLKTSSSDVLPYLRILNHFFGQPSTSINQRRPKIAIISDKGGRVNQIAETLEQHQSQQSRFKITKYVFPINGSNLILHQNQSNQAINDNDVFVFKSKDFHESLMRAHFKIYDYDAIMFDDVHQQSLPDQYYNRIMTEFYFQISKSNILLPLIFGFSNFDNLFQEGHSISQITSRLMCYSNMFNANLAVLNENQAKKIMRDAFFNTQNIRFQFFQPSSIINTIRDTLKFITAMNTNLVIGNQSWTQGTQIYPHQEIYSLKNQDSSIMQFTTKVGSKLTTKESKRIFQEFFESLNKHIIELHDKIIVEPFTVKVENVQYVCPQSKIRYFSSRFELDLTMSCFLGLKGLQPWFYSINLAETKQPVEGALAPQKLYLFKKRLESEDHLYLQLCQLLHSNGFIDDHLSPNEPGIIKCLNEKFGKIIPKPIVIAQKPTKSFKKEEESKSPKEQKENRENFKIIVERHNEQFEKEIYKQSDFVSAQLQYNCQKIQFFIREIINPIMQAVYQYEQRIMIDQSDAISWVKFDKDQSDSSENKTKEIKSKNQKFLSYAKEIFFVNESERLDSSIEFMDIVGQIDPCVEKLSMPSFIDVGFTEEHLMNRICLGIFLVVAMTPQTSDHAIEEELKRMALVGHQAINTAVVLNMYLKYQGTLSEKESEKQRLKSLSSSNLKKKGSEYGINSLLLKSQEIETEPRDSRQVVECFAGFFDVYLCFSSAYLFMHDLGVIETSLEQPLLRTGENSSEYKQQVLEEVSSQYSQIMLIEKEVKTEIYQQIVQSDQTSNDNNASFKFIQQQALIERLVSGKNDDLNADESEFYDEEIKQQELPHKQPQDEAGSVGSLIDEFNQRGYIHKCKAILMQCFTDKSFSENLAAKSEGKINLSQRSLELIQKQRESLGQEQIDNFSMIKHAILQLNNIKFAQLGKSLLVQTLAKTLYIETFNQPEGQLFSAHRMSQLLTKSTSKEWLGYLLCEKFFDMFTQSSENNQISSKAEEIQHVGYNQQETSLSLLTSVPILLDHSNIKLKEDVARYEQTVYLQCSDHYQQRYNSDCEELKGNDYQKQVDKDFNEQQDHFVEVYSDTMCALMGGIFLDSRDFQFTQQQILVFLKSVIYPEGNPFVDEERAKVIEVWKSKKYTEGIKITHLVEKKEEFIYIKIFFGKLEVRRCKFEKQKVNKVSKAYLDLRFYLENAYKQFEAKWWPKKYNVKETNVNQEHWLAFNQEYRKQYHPNKTAEIQRRQYSLFKEACKQLQTDYFDEKTTSQIIIDALTNGARMQHISQDSILLAVEDERSSSSKIREIFNNCGIYQINTLSEKNKDLKSWVNNLSEYNLECLHQQMENFQSLLHDLVHSDGIEIESGSMTSTQCNSIHI